jgi:2-polyprenyl-3-methyl-5-hydroxy-6-metoxy-1,4-benzoquinol methylase
MSDKFRQYMDGADRFSRAEMYQTVPGYDGKASRNLAERWAAYDIPQSALIDKHIVDVGCNVGGFSAYCAPHCASYLGIDSFVYSIRLARELYQFQNCRFEPIRFCDLAGTWDVMLALAVRRYTELTYDQFAERAASLLSDGGMMYFESHTREKWGPTPRAAFSKRFNIKRVLTVPGTSHPDCTHTRFFVELEKR